MRVTVPDCEFAAQTDVVLLARSNGPRPTAISLRALPSGLIRMTLPVALSATHRKPLRLTIPIGRSPTCSGVPTTFGSRAAAEEALVGVALLGLLPPESARTAPTPTAARTPTAATAASGTRRRGGCAGGAASAGGGAVGRSAGAGAVTDGAGAGRDTASRAASMIAMHVG